MKIVAQVGRMIDGPGNDGDTRFVGDQALNDLLQRDVTRIEIRGDACQGFSRPVDGVENTDRLVGGALNAFPVRIV